MTDRAEEFADLYRRHAAAVYRFAFSLAHESGDAEDITSETFARAFSSSAPLRQGTIRAYLFTIARRYYLETRRKRSRDVALDDTLHDPMPPPSARVEGASELAHVGDALGRLSDAERTAILMRAVHDMSYGEIARTLNISVAAAKVRVHRARLALSEDC